MHNWVYCCLFLELFSLIPPLFPFIDVLTKKKKKRDRTVSLWPPCSLVPVFFPFPSCPSFCFGLQGGVETVEVAFVKEGGFGLGPLCIPVLTPHLARFRSSGPGTSFPMHLTTTQDHRARIYVCLHHVLAVTSNKPLILTSTNEFYVK